MSTVIHILILIKEISKMKLLFLQLICLLRNFYHHETAISFIITVT